MVEGLPVVKSVYLQNSLLKFAFPSVCQTSGRYSAKQHSIAQLCIKQDLVRTYLHVVEISWFSCCGIFGWPQHSMAVCVNPVTVAEHHLPYGVTCHPTQVNVPSLNSSQTGQYLIYLPWRDGRLSWPGCFFMYWT